MSDRSDSRVLATLVIAVIGFAVQQTSVVPAVQTIQASLGGSSEWAAWLVTVYLIVATVATPAMGRLGDLHGRRRMLLIGLGLFVIGSAAAALAPSMPVLIVCRAFQGVGGAVYPLSLAIARDVLPERRVTFGVSVLTAAFGAGTAIGFVGGGLLAEYASWRWIFAGGAVLVALGVVLAWRVLPDSKERASGSYDVRGTVVLAVAVISLLTALTLVVPYGWAAPPTITLFVLSALAGGGWVLLERRHTDPLVDIHIFAERGVAVADIATIGLGWALFGSYLLLPELIETDPVHTGFGLAAGSAAVGFILLPLAVGQTVAGSVAGRLSGVAGPRPVYATGLVMVSAALALLCLVHRSAVDIALLDLLLGLGAGLALQASSSVATQGVADDVAAASSALNSTVRRLAGGIGGQVATILLASLLLAGGGPSHSAYVTAFLVAAAISLLGAGVVAGRS